MAGQNNTLVIGGGWSGLAAAIELSRQHHPVQVLESARQLGGRARRVPFDNTSLDNGQHLLIGAYRDTLQLLKTIGLDPEQVLQRFTLDWQVFSPHHKKIRIQAYTAPAPLHLLFGLLSAQGLHWRDKYRALLLGHKLWKGDSLGEQDISVQQWLDAHQQSTELVEAFWEPLCLATLNTPLETASAKTFVRVLSDAFLKSAAASDYLIPRQDLSGMFVDPALTFIEKNGGTIRLAHKVDEILLQDNHVTGVRCQDQVIAAEHIILSTPPNISAGLLAHIPGLEPLVRQLAGFHYHPICTVYLRYPKDTCLPTTTPVVGMRQRLCQWVFDRRVCQQAGIIAVVISSSGAHMALDNAELIRQVAGELAECFPHWPAHSAAKVIREKRATFACSVGIDTMRPPGATAVTGLYLAGDYIDTGYPATLEGAIQSGLRAARHILQ
ncbi:MAG: hydroxysqualene dehydroxylase HpnE [Gammaproteobacteria bacterium]